METIVEKLDEFRSRRHEAAQWKYAEIMQRYDRPQPGDAEELDKAMIELHVEPHQLEHDIHLIERYREYLRVSKNQDASAEVREQARKDAEGIRHGTKALFLTLDDQESH